MKRFLCRLGGLMPLALAAVVPLSVARADPAFHLLKEIVVGGRGGWDYLAVDSDGHRLYVAHATKIVVIDTDSDSVVGEIDNTPGVHGFAIAPDLQRGYSSNGKEAKVSIVDLKTLKTLSKVATGENPDAILYASGTHEVYVFNGKGRSVTVFDAGTGSVVATIPLPGKPEFAAYDPTAGLVYDNIEDKDEVVVIDSKSHRIVNTWPIAPGASASGLAIDVDNHRLFIGCHNQLMLMMDSTNGKVLSTVPIGQGVDATGYDAVSHLAFSSSGDGTLTIAYEDSPEQLIIVQDVMTQKGARTMAFDSRTEKVYLATAQYEQSATDQPLLGASDPVPGSFEVLVFGK